MIVAYADFIAAFPEFASATQYPEAQFTFWEAQAEAQLSAPRFGTSLPLAIMLFVAHNVVLSAKAAQNPASVGAANGITSSKSIDGVSVSYDTKLTSFEGAGFWNATSYGQRLWTMLKAFSIGPVYVPGRPSFSPLGGRGYPRF